MFVQRDLSWMAGLLIRVKGDGRTYMASMRTVAPKGRWARTPFRADFETVNGEITQRLAAAFRAKVERDNDPR